MIDKDTILQKIDQQRQKVWPRNDGQVRIVDVPKRFEQGWLNALRWIKELISSTPKFNIGQSIVPKNHQESGLLITDIRDGSYYSCDLEICKITEDDQWELEDKPVSKELEEASKGYQKKMYGYTVKDDIIATDCSNQQNIIDIDDAFKAGANWQKQQILKYSKEGVVTDHGGFIKFNDDTWIDLDPTEGLIPAFPLNDGEMVKAIIIKP